MMNRLTHRVSHWLHCAAISLLVLCAMGAPLRAATAPEPAISAPQRTLVVAMDDNYPPYIFRDDAGALTGYLVDYWKLWESKTGVAVELLASDWDIAKKRMAAREAMVIDTIFKTSEREKTLDFTPPYAQIPVSIYTHTGIGGIANVGHLKGFLVGVKAGDACVDTLKTAGVQTLQLYPNYETLVQAAVAGQVKIFCLDEPPAHYFLYKLHAESMFHKSVQLSFGELHRAVHKDDSATLALLKQGHMAISAAEEEALRSKWMGTSLIAPSHARTLGYALLIGGLIGAFLLLWGALLRNRVTRRTAELESERARLRVVLEAIPDLVWMKDLDGTFRFCNPMFQRSFNASEADIIGKTDYDFVDRELADVFRAHDQDAIAAGRPTVSENWITFADDGHRALMETTKTPVRGAHGEMTGVLGVARDITERKTAETALRVAAAAFESQQGMLICDANNAILRINQSFSEMSGYALHEVVGKTPSMFSSGRHAPDFFAAMWASIHTSGGWQGEIWDRKKDGSIYPKWMTITAVKDDAGLVTHYIATHTDISERKASEAQIHSLAFFDPLTLLPNRRLLADRLRQALASSSRSHREGALLFIDIDHFKTLNDTLGHDKGDLLLQEVAKRVTGCIREGDTVARLGGDEFVVMLENLSENTLEAASQTESVGEKILAALCLPYDLRGYAYRSSASIGLTLFGAPHNTSEDLMKRADLAMYQAKSGGRNSLRFFDPKMQADVSARASLEADLRDGLQRQEFILFYQPQLNAQGAVTGAESLVRWQHPQRGMVSPAEFIALAEDTGLILPLGDWVLQTACHQLSAWANSPERAHLTIAVNVSARQFHQDDFVASVLAVLARTGANPLRLKLELTESLLVSNVDATIEKMLALKARGISFSLDDFGTGYSSLAYLKRLPLDQLKIDQGFVRDILIDPNDATIAKTIVALAASMGLEVIAEGVETEAQRHCLAALGCTAYQGYLFSRPLPIQALEQFLNGV